MESTSRLHVQIAIDAGVSEDEAKVAAYMLDLSRAGKTLDHAASLLRKERGDARDVARDWGISFPDYTPTTPRKLAWHKPVRGEWVMQDGQAVLARITPKVDNGTRRYWARWEYDNGYLSAEGSSAEIAARRLSKMIERQSLPLFGMDDIEIHFLDAGRLAPDRAADPFKLRSALHGAA